MLELTLPKGELPSPCDQRPEGVPEGPPNRRVKVMLMVAISYDVPTLRLAGSDGSRSGDLGIVGTPSALSDCLSLGALTCVWLGLLFAFLSVSAPASALDRQIGQEHCTPDSRSGASIVFAGPTQTGCLVMI